jgi:membrane protein
MKSFLKNGIELLRETLREFQDDQAARQAAALAYFTVLSLAPLLILIISVAGIVFGQENVQRQIIAQAAEALGEGSAELIEDALVATYQPGVGLVATIAGVVMLFVGASNVLNQLKTSLNYIWGVSPETGRGVRGIVIDRIVTITIVLGVGFLLLVSLVIQTALSIVLSAATDLAPGVAPLLRTLNFVVAFGVITLLFAMIYRFLPNVEIAWGDVWIGAAVTSLLFAVGQFAISLYIANSGVASAYGAAGALVIILIWIYYSASILLFGAEFTQVYVRRFGSRIQPSSGFTRDGLPDESPQSTPDSPAAEQPEVKPQTVIVPVPQESQGWFAGFLGGLAVLAAGLLTGLLFNRRER